ncbi:DUF6069 family protein [Streptomyces arenae]|uniref:DUF6069 family protein n=1 Tax=Streptomyces arenae TaxID=29301 RepID=UPI002658620C|nr:DUF6069 family protein [Streptomyces arenae]MCG7208418.1 DUF6069 family protein [Streptomyces arenae]
MSVTSETVAVRRGPLVVVGGVLAAVVAASVADTVISLIALAAGAPDDFQPLKAGSYIFLTAVGTVLGALGWAVVRKVARDPGALTRRLVPAVVVVSFVPDFLLYGSGGAIGVAALLLMHVAVAVVAVFAYRKVMPLS